MAVRALPATLPRINWWYAGLLILNVGIVAATLYEIPRYADWKVIERAARLAGNPELYAPAYTGTWVWSPVAAYAVKVMIPLGVELWRLVLIAAALAMPTWTLRAVVIVSWPFWADFANGNVLTVIFLAAVWAMRGSTVGTFAFFTFALLRPMPLLAPMCLWLVVNRPEWRLRVAAMFVIHVGLVVWTGLGDEWVGTLLSGGSELQTSGYNLGPTRWLGYWWLVGGIPLGLWLYTKGRVGWAGLAISPYIWSYYLFWLLPEVNRRAMQEPRLTEPRP
jgi:hypothetical protein